MKGIEYKTTLPPETEFAGINCDSRQISSGELFFAIRGVTQDGRRYIPAAVEKGATGVVVDSGTGMEKEIPHITVADCREAYSRAAINLFHNPANNLFMTGITGTNGKTTVAWLIYHIYRQAGRNAAAIGTLGFTLNQSWLEGNLTTPDPLLLNARLSDFLKQGGSHVVMEVSSHALELKRVAGLKFDLAIFTNLTQDHLDFHRIMEAYARSKAKLFQMIKDNGIALINLDDQYAGIMLQAARNNKHFTYSLENPQADFYWQKFTSSREGIAGRMVLMKKELEVESHLSGKFNAYNLLAAAAGMSFFFDLSVIRDGIKNVKAIPGRYEKIDFPGSPLVVVDYAHTPDAMENILQALREEKAPEGKLIVVFGCGGDRDTAKRPKMARVAEKYGDLIFLTSDNPRFEDPMKIIEMAEKGIKEQRKLTKEVDRRIAIEKALKSAGPQDLVAILGKGHETYQEIKGERHHFDDREVVREILRELQHQKG